MRLESIKIKDFRQYRDVKFEFKRMPGKRDIHIIVGEGGEGKTNILNALTWCLYEDEMHLRDKSSAIAMINSQYVQEIRKRGEKNGVVSVTVEISSEEERLKWKIQRTATFSVTETEVFQTSTDCYIIKHEGNGDKIIDKKEDIDTYIQRYVPQEINDYIFFDGEHLDSYFKDDNKKLNIENGIKDLTQATILKKTIDALEKYVKQEITPILQTSDDKVIRDAQDEVTRLQNLYEERDATVKEFDTQIKELDKDIEEYTQKISGHENLKEQALQLERLEGEAEQLDKDDKDATTALMKFVREYYTYFALYPSMKSFADYIQKQSEAGNLPPKIDKKLVASMLVEKKCLICDQPLDAKHLAGIEALLKRLEVSSATSAELNKASTALSAYFDKLSQYEEQKKTYVSTRVKIRKALSDNADKYKELNDKIKQIPNSEQIAQAINDREQCVQARDHLKEKIGQEKYLLAKTELELGEAQKALDKAMSKNRMMTVYKKQKDFCSESVLLLKETMNEILTECRNDMQTATFKIFEQLMWKKNAFSKIEILEDYSFLLFDRFGTQTLGSCSAAESALLALSFTLALQEISKHDSLLYIDTPLGRVGEKSRATFSDVLLKISENKQVVLTFTPTEYDSNVQAKLGPASSSYCRLKYDELTGITTNI